jgi:hypothetical protein
VVVAHRRQWVFVFGCDGLRVHGLIYGEGMQLERKGAKGSGEGIQGRKGERE